MPDFQSEGHSSRSDVSRGMPPASFESQEIHLKPVEIAAAHPFKSTFGLEFIGKAWFNDGIIHWVDQNDQDWRVGIKFPNDADLRQSEMEDIFRKLRAAGYEVIPLATVH